MKFKVKRTSTYNADADPQIPGAYRVETERVVTDKVMPWGVMPLDWHHVGENHRHEPFKVKGSVRNYGIKDVKKYEGALMYERERTVVDTAWFIDAETLDEAVQMIPTHEVIVSGACQGDDFDWALEAYDDYRE